jgi:hypothetical protein
MTPSASSEEWARRAARVGRCVARFRLANRPQTQGWRMNRVTAGAARCIGCDDPFEPGEAHVEVVAAQTVVFELHDECFEVWTRHAPGGRPTPADPDADEPDDV